MMSDEVCTSYTKLAELQEKVQKLENEIEERMTEWEELSNLIN